MTIGRRADDPAARGLGSRRWRTRAGSRRGRPPRRRRRCPRTSLPSTHPPGLEGQPVEEHELGHRGADHVVPQLLADSSRAALSRDHRTVSPYPAFMLISSSQVSSRRAPKPVPPLVSSPRSTSDRPTPAMSRCAQRRVADELAQEQCCRDRARAAARSRYVVDVGDLAVEQGAVVLHQRQRPEPLPRRLASGRRAPRASASSVAYTGAMAAPEGDPRGPGEGGDVEQDVGVEVPVGVGEGVRHDQAALGVGVADLDGAPAVLRDDVAGAVGGAAHGVLGQGEQAGDAHRDLQVAAGGQHREHDRRARHVGLHREHALSRLDVEPAGVEGDALADEHHARRLPVWPSAARSRPAPAGAASPRPRRRPAGRRSPRVRSSASVHTRTLEAGGTAEGAGLLGHPGGVLEVRRRHAQVAGQHDRTRARGRVAHRGCILDAHQRHQPDRGGARLARLGAPPGRGVAAERAALDQRRHGVG